MKIKINSFGLPNKKMVRSCFAAAALMSGVVNFQAQVKEYTFEQSNGAFTSITGTTLLEATGNATATNLNSNVSNLALPFSFNFNGTNYNDLNVSTNGFLTFGTTVPGTTVTTPISSTTAYDGAISVFGRDISSFYQIGTPPLTGKIQYTTVGTAPNREFVIEWSNFRVSSSTSTTAVHDFSFQLRLQEGTNYIKMVYGPNSFLVGTSTTASTVQVGLRGTTVADFYNRMTLSTQAFGASDEGVANNSSQYFSTASGAASGMPASGLTYIFKPATCKTVTNLTASNIGINNATVSWNASPSAPLGAGYEVYYTTSNVAPTSTTVPQITGLNATTTPLSNLTAATNYYVWVRSACSATDKSKWSEGLMFRTLCQPPALAVSPSAATVCLGGVTTLTGTTDANATIKWYDSSTSTTPIATGNSFTTPALSTTTTYYASAGTGGTHNVGKLEPSSSANATGGGLSSYMNFTANSDFVLKTVDLFPYSATAGNPGTVVIALRDASGNNIMTKTVNVVGQTTLAASTPQTVTLDFPIAGGASYRLGVVSWTGVTNMFRDSSGFTYPYTVPGVVDITGPSTSGYYYFFYNWSVQTSCETPRQPIVVTVDTNCLSTSEVGVKNDLKVYPNPFVDVVNISNVDEVKSAAIMDASGRVVKVLSKVSQQISLGDLKSGMYVLSLDMKNGSKQSVKLIKK